MVHVGLVIRAPCGPMRISLGFLNVAHLTTQYMDVTSLLAWNLFYVSRLCKVCLFIQAV